MDPVTLATITSGVTILATEAGKGLAGNAGKDLWDRIKAVLGWKEDPAPEELAPKVAKQLETDEETARRIVALLQQRTEMESSAAAIVGNVSAERLIVIKDQTVAGDFNITM